MHKMSKKIHSHSSIQQGASSKSRYFRMMNLAMKRLLVAIVLFFVFTRSVSAFDSSRQGVVVGGGLGHAVNSHWGNSDTPFNENRRGVGFNFLAGYAWDNRNLVALEINATSYVSEVEWGEGRFTGFTNQNVLQGFVGVNWYHYYPAGRVGEFFTSAGLGMYSFNVQAVDANKPGVGALIGFGFAYKRHFQLGFYLAGGRTSSSKSGFSHSHISILASALAF